MQTLLQDLRYGIRMLLGHPGFTLVAVITLALGIGANTAIFSFVNAVILRPLPYPAPEQLVGLGQCRIQAGVGYIQTGVSPPNVISLREQAQSFQQVSYYRWDNFNLTQGNPPERLRGARVSVSLLPMFGVEPLVGRFFFEPEASPGNEQVAVISHRLWQTSFGSDPRLVGKTIELDQKRYTVVGILPAEFKFVWDAPLDVLVPLALGPKELSDGYRGSRDLETLARLRPGVSRQRPQGEVDGLARRLVEQYPEANKGWGMKVEPLHGAYHRRMETPLLVLVGGVACVLLIACANVANLLLARATVRRKEIAIRLAMGASRARMVRQLLTESVLLSVLGGAAGLLLAAWGAHLLTVGSARYFSIPNAREINLDGRVMAFSLALSLVTGIVFGLAPAFQSSRADLNESLKEGTKGATAEPGRRRLRDVLVIAEIALAMVLMTGAGLFLRTFASLLKVELGYDPKNVLNVNVSLPRYKYQDDAQWAVFSRQLLERLRSTPGIEAAASLAGGGSILFNPEGRDLPPPGQEPTASSLLVTPDYFRAMCARLLEGRDFTEADSPEAPRVAIINETLARRYWPHENPVGHRLIRLSRIAGQQDQSASPALEIVGVVRDIKQGQQLWQERPEVYVPYLQQPAASLVLVVRTGSEPRGMAAAVRDAVLAVDKGQPVQNARTLEEGVANQFGQISFWMSPVWIFAALALVLAAVGIFGVMSYSVTQRTHEIAIRLALGAARRDVLKLVIGEGLTVALIGVVAGAGAALALGRIVSSYLYGVEATDPLTFAGVALALTAVALLACWLPARRAMKVDPLVALRYE